jgi:Uma2 family endonuclease
VSSTITKLTTANELLAMPDDGYRYELIEGELIRMSPAGDEHGRVIMRISGPLFVHVDAHNLGNVYGAETGFLLQQNPDTVRAPEVAFVSKERVEATGRILGYRAGAPDLVVEVSSPSDRKREIHNKAAEWLAAGSRLVWVVDPKTRTITVYRSVSDVETLSEKDLLEGEGVVPGFRIEVVKIFDA